MKKLFVLIMCMVFVICSCSNLTPSNTAKAGFVFDESCIESIVRSATTIADDAKIKFVVKLIGEVEDSKVVETTLAELRKNDLSISFEKIPLGKTFKIAATGFVDNEPVYIGSSEEETLTTEAVTTVSLKAEEFVSSKYVLQWSNYSENHLAFFSSAKEIEDVKLENFKDPFVDSENQDRNGQKAHYSDYAFDKNGFIWVIKDNVVYTRVIPKNEAGELSKDWDFVERPMDSDFTPKALCVDKASNTLYIAGSGTSDKMIFKSFKINPNGTNLVKNEDGTYKSLGSYESSLTNNAMPGLCIEANDDSIYCTIGDNYITRINIKSSTDAVAFIDFSKNEALKNLFVSDMIYQDGYLYALLNKVDGWISFRDSKFNVTSCGAVVKLDPITLKIIGIIGLAEKSEVKAQLPGYYDGKPIYTDADKTTEIPKKEFVINLNAPTTDDSNFLFGPQKFIAIKPKRLVISDGGVFCYEKDDDWFYSPISRIVSVDLESFSIVEKKVINLPVKTICSGDVGDWGSSSSAPIDNVYYYNYQGSSYTLGSVTPNYTIKNNDLFKFFR